jgi:ABC-type sugar transport system substrate-binding protein
MIWRVGVFVLATAAALATAALAAPASDPVAARKIRFGIVYPKSEPVVRKWKS